MNSDNSQVDLNTLQWVKSEIDETLKQARTALEAHVESPDDDSQLQLVINYMHQVRGTLQMVELYGAAMLSEELETLSQAIANKDVESRDDIYEVMMRAMWQLPDYLERLQSGHKDIPMVLLPLLNDLRAARRAPLLTESALFTPDLDVDVPDVLEYHSEEALPQLAKKLRHTYHLGLLDWYRERDSDGGLHKLDEVINKLRHAANDQEVNRVLWSASGVIEALLEGGIQPSVAVKLLMGKLDREIKKIIDQGESVISNERPEELEKNLLYYVASSSSEGEKVNALKKTFKLADALPDEATLERARADLTGPNAELLQTVSKVLLENLLQVKDSLDVFVRAEQRDPASLTPLVESLGQTADTLGMLGFGKQRLSILEQSELLAAFAGGGQELDENQLMDIAHELLSIETMLLGAASGRADTRVDDDESQSELTNEVVQQQLLESVMAEARKNMGKVKDAMGSFLETPRNINLINEVPDWLDQIRGSFEILSLQRPAQLVDTCRMYVQQEVIDAMRSPDPASTDALADALSSIEYYMDSVSGQWGNPKAILEVAEQRLAQIGFGEHIETLSTGVSVAHTEEDEQSDQPMNDVLNDLPKAEQIPEDDDDTMIDLGMPGVGDTSSATIQIDEDLDGLAIDVADMSTAELSISDFEAELQAKGISLADTAADSDTQEIEFDASQFKTEGEQELTEEIELAGNASHEIEFDTNSLELDKGTDDSSSQFVNEIEFDAHSLELDEEADESRSQSGTELKFDPDQFELADILDMAEEIDVDASTTTQEIEFDASQLDVSSDLKLDNEPAEDDSIQIPEIEYDATQLETSSELEVVVEPEYDSNNQTQEIEYDNSIVELVDNDKLSDQPLVKTQVTLSARDIPELTKRLEEWYSDTNNEVLTKALRKSITNIKKQAKQMGRDDVAKVANDMAALFKSINKGETNLTGEVKSSLNFAIDTLTEVLPAEPPSVTDNVVPLKSTPVTPIPEVRQLPDEIDEEIVEIFLEEAEEELVNINQRLSAWRDNPSDEEVLSELRRSFHTLKGSGRLVGASEVGEFAWSFENMLNRVIDHTIESGAVIFDLLEEARQTLPELFEQFKSGGKAGQEVFALMERAEAVSQGAVSMDRSEEIDTSMTIDEESISHEEASDVAVVPEIDEALLEIYLKETDNHLEALQEYLDGWRNGTDKSANQKLVRVLHTMTGSSRTAGVPGLAELCGRFEKLANEMSSQNIEVSDSMLKMLDKSMAFIQQTVAVLDTPGAPLPDNSDLISELEQQDVSMNTVQVTSDLDVLHQDEVVDAPLPATMSEYDEELLHIFIEEGSEILDECDQILHRWARDRDNPEYIEALQRQLHTLKGGARMAGVMAIGDLSHSIESMLTAVFGDQMEASPEVYDILQRAQDKQVYFLEQLKARETLTPDNDLLQTVDELTRSKQILDKEHEQVIPENIVEEEDDHWVVETDLSFDETATETEYATAESVEEEPRTELEIVDEEVPFDEPVIESEQTGLVRSNVAENSPLLDNVVPISNLKQLKVTTKPPTVSEEMLPEAATVREQVRVRSDLLDNLVNFAGEVSIYRSRMEQQTNAFRYNLQELDDTVNRLRDQLRKFEIEAEAQIQYRAEESLSRTQEDFDPLEFDRFTQMQQLSRGMLESLSDLDSLRGILGNLTRESETLLVQQSRVNTELQEGLMHTRMVPFSTQAVRLRRIVRQTAEELGKNAELHLHGAENEMDRTVLDRMLPALEHMLRNAIAHGVENKEARAKAGKTEAGQINLTLSREGADIIMKLSDDGAGIDLDAIQRKAVEKGKLKPGTNITKETLLELIMESGFSTAEEITQISGRGVGMDVVNSEIKQLGGLLNIDTEQGIGTSFIISLPLTLSVTRALMVNVGEDTYAIPLLSVEGVERIDAERLQKLYNEKNPVYQWIGQDYPFLHLGSTMGISTPHIPQDRDKIPLLMVRSGEFRAAVQVDSLIGSREVVVKPVGAQLSTIRGISGATIMGDGSVVLIIDLGVLIRMVAQQTGLAQEVVTVAPVVEKELAPLVMVVDDSITVRKVTTRLLERNNYRAISAKDGVDALAQLLEVRPDVILLDVEMPRMDGFELATNIRNDDQLQDIPLIMITSRTGHKHRDRANAIGVNFYLGKPYNEGELLESIQSLVDTV